MEPLSIKAVTYFFYLAISIAITIWVGRTLHKNGRAFLIDAFHENEEIADSVNHLLVVGFYLINLGYVTLMLTSRRMLHDIAGATELLSVKVGSVLLILGAMHFFNLYIFSRMRKSALINRMLPPVAPDGMVSGSAPVGSGFTPPPLTPAGN